MASNKIDHLSWSEAVLSTNGPSSIKDAVILFIKGLFMGAANIIPGVSGGTIALITGIYQELILAIKSLDINTLKLLKQLKIKQALCTIHLKFLFVLMAGVGLAILTLAHVMNYVFNNYPIYTWSLFFGLILASILVMGIQNKSWIGPGGLSFIFGTISAYVFVGLIPVSTPESWWFILFVGMIAICTMILPGLSGAFLLLILGKYEYITNALKNPFIPENLTIIIIFGTGCVIGIILFSRMLSFLLKNWENSTMAVLTGIMCGSLRKVWPWKEVAETKIIRGTIHTISENNILPQEFGVEFVLAITLIIFGFIAVMVLEKIASK